MTRTTKHALRSLVKDVSTLCAARKAPFNLEQKLLVKMVVDRCLAADCDFPQDVVFEIFYQMKKDFYIVNLRNGYFTIVPFSWCNGTV